MMQSAIAYLIQHPQLALLLLRLIHRARQEPEPVAWLEKELQAILDKPKPIDAEFIE